MRRPSQHPPTGRSSKGSNVARMEGGCTKYELPRTVRRTVIDFRPLHLPVLVRRALAEAFWCHYGAQAEGSIITRWQELRVFDRFSRETGTVCGLTDLDHQLLLRYVEWLNQQRRPNGQPWTKSAKAGAFSALRKLLQWIERCRPVAVSPIEYPFNPFPWRNRDTRPRSKMPAAELRNLLRACEEDIARIRAERETTVTQRVTDAGEPGTLSWLLDQIERRFGGIVPTALELARPGQHPVRVALQKHGGLKGVEPHLYPRCESLLPYYLAILIHTAGNPDPIAELNRDCLQSLPLLEDRQALVWIKRRAGSIQRRAFSSTKPFEPPALVKEILRWNERLQPLAPAAVRDRLFLFKSAFGVTALSSNSVKKMVEAFCERHDLPRFSLASIRPGVLSAFYRATGSLSRVKSIANHANLSTTVRYVQTPEVEAQHRSRIANLQHAFLGHIEKAGTPEPKCSASEQEALSRVVPRGEVDSMFGFSCKDPCAGVAPGTRCGELCTNYMGCLICPNAVIPPEPRMLARLLQARDHLRAEAAAIHPARWEKFYAPQLRILEEDILPRFDSQLLAAARPLAAQLSPLPDLR